MVVDGRNQNATSSATLGVKTTAECCELNFGADLIRWSRSALGSVSTSDYVSSSH